jgi:hypothetical protein
METRIEKLKEEIAYLEYLIESDKNKRVKFSRAEMIAFARMYLERKNIPQKEERFVLFGFFPIYKTVKKRVSDMELLNDFIDDYSYDEKETLL